MIGSNQIKSDKSDAIRSDPLLEPLHELLKIQTLTPVVDRCTMAGPLLWTTSEPIYLCSNDNDEEDEVFFGPTSSAELRRRELLSNRRRTLLVDGTAVAACLAANRIQAWMRMLPLRQVFVAQRKAAQQVQQWWRLVRERSLRHRAATKIAATWRAHVARKQYARTLRTILFIQARWRFKTTLKKRSLQPATNDSQAASRRTVRSFFEVCGFAYVSRRDP